MSEINFDEMQTLLMMQFDQIIKEQDKIDQDIKESLEIEKRQAERHFAEEAEKLKSQLDSISRIISEAKEKLSVHFKSAVERYSIFWKSDRE